MTVPLTKKQFLTLGYTLLAQKKGIDPTCRNVLELMKEHKAFRTEKCCRELSENAKGKEYGEYQNMRSTFAQLEHYHKVVIGKPIACFVPSRGGRPSNGFYPTEKGMNILKERINDT